MKKYDTKRLVTLAMMTAIAYLAVAFIRIPAVSFLKYEPKDVILVITGFLFGPLDALVITVIVALVEMMTISTTGPIGLLMNVIASASFACTAAAVYQKNRTLKGALLGLGIGIVLMTALMMLWNYLVTPIYQGVPRSVVAGMLLPVFLPFNLIKGVLNAGITMLLYKPVVQSLRRAHLVPGEGGKAAGNKKATACVAVISLFVVASCILLFLVLSGKM